MLCVEDGRKEKGEICRFLVFLGGYGRLIGSNQSEVTALGEVMWRSLGLGVIS